MRSGIISESTRFRLDLLTEEAPYRNDAVLLLSESVCRQCDEAAYQAYARDCGLPAALDQTSFLNTLIDDLSVVGLHWSEDALVRMYENLSRRTELAGQYGLVLAFVCARLQKREKLDEILPIVEQSCGAKQTRRMKRFWACHSSAAMAAVYRSVQAGSKPQPDQLKWTDSLGLTALHYAILLRQETLTEVMLKTDVWRRKPPLPEDDEAAAVYDFTVTACLVGSSDREMICQRTSPLILAQLKSKKALERRLMMKKATLAIQNKTYHTMRDAINAARRNHVPEKAAELREKLEELKYRRQTTHEEINELESTISDIAEEIDRMTQDAMVTATTASERLKASGNPFIRFVLKLYRDPNLLRSVLECAEKGCRLYIYQNLIFTVPAEISVDLPLFDDSYHDHTNEERHGGSQRGAEGPVRKPYGNSWFSPEAHSSIQKLREEYRVLAKKYHPDVCKRPDSKSIFQEILNEQTQILEAL